MLVTARTTLIMGTSISLLMVLLGCGTAPQSPTTDACINHADCGTDKKCFSGECLAVECFYSADCPRGFYCDDSYSCVAGCTSASDCLAGEACDIVSNECLSYGCRETQLDCALGEWCIDGECMVATPSPCTTCDYLDWKTGIGDEQECVLYSFLQDVNCDWRDNVGCPEHLNCFPSDGLGLVEDGICVNAYGFLRCDTSTDCPRGFFCKPDIYQNGEGINVCWADCRFFLEQGFVSP